MMLLPLPQALADARALLATRDPRGAVALLAPHMSPAQAQKATIDDLVLLQTLAEAHLDASGAPPAENDDEGGMTEDEFDDQMHAQIAYELFLRAAQVDDKAGSKGGYEKFLWLGQLSGGQDAVKWFRVGCDALRTRITRAAEKPGNEDEVRMLRRKLCDALCSTVEIWMTDLCMEPEAEVTCEKLVAEALMVDDTHSESHATLASVRISQQRLADARIAVQRAWELYCDAYPDTDATPEEQVAQLGALKTLARLGLETEHSELAADASRRMLALDEDIAEAWYLLGLAQNSAGIDAAAESFQQALELLEAAAGEDEDAAEMLADVRQRLAGVCTEGGGGVDGMEEDDEDAWLDEIEEEE
ncbi:uncharacterized protein V1518DRAFT_78655 [Limtongia smithiae]|uniref:uncharacterized protein n=1 Tax=Limtongia smithiae TaxID=1125753 RepID=UPI0034CEBB18